MWDIGHVAALKQLTRNEHRKALAKQRLDAADAAAAAGYVPPLAQQMSERLLEMEAVLKDSQQQ